MVYTQRQLLTINATKSALEGKFYDQDNGDVYLGTRNGTLVEWSLAKTNFIDSPVVSSDNTKGAIEELSAKESSDIKTINDDFTKSFLFMGG